MKVRMTMPRKLKKTFVARRKRAVKSMNNALETGVKKYKKAEKSGALDKWKTRVGLGLQAVEVATVALALVKGRKLAKKAAAPRRARKSTAKRG